MVFFRSSFLLLSTIRRCHRRTNERTKATKFPCLSFSSLNLRVLEIRTTYIAVSFFPRSAARSSSFSSLGSSFVSPLRLSVSRSLPHLVLPFFQTSLIPYWTFLSHEVQLTTKKIYDLAATILNDLLTLISFWGRVQLRDQYFP